MPSLRSDPGRVLGAGTVVGIVLLLLASGMGSVAAAPRAPGGPPTARPAPAELAQTSGSVDGRIFNTSVSPLAGVAENNRLAVDPTHGLGYSLNRHAGFLVAFNLSTGTAVRAARLADPVVAMPYALALDAPDHALFVSVNTTAPVAPYLLVVNTTTLTVVANLSNFGGVAGFAPGFVTYDPASGHVLVENQTTLTTAVVDPGTDTVLAVVAFPACAACRPHGYVDVPTTTTVVLPSGLATIPTLNTGTDVPGADLVAPEPGFVSGVGAFDNVSGTIFLANDSATGGIDSFTAAGVYAGSFAGPAQPSAAAFLWTADLLALADYNTSYPGAGWDVSTWFAATQAPAGHYDNPAVPYWEPGYSFTGLYADIEPTGTFLITSGAGNATVRFQVNATTGALQVARAYAGFPNDRVAILADPANGRYYAVDRDPAGVTAYAPPGGARLWQMDLTYDYATYHALTVAIDPVQGYLYVDFGSTFVDVYATATGSYLSSIFFPSPVGALAVDATDHLLFVAALNGTGSGPTNVSIVTTSQDLNTIVGTIPWDQPACTLALLPGVGELAAAGCNDTAQTTVALFSTVTGAPVGNVTGPPGGATTLVADANGSLWWADPGSGRVVEFNVSQGAFGVNWTVGHPVGGIALDLADGVGLATSPTAPVVDVVALANGTVGATIPLGAPAGSVPAFDPASASFLVPLRTTGQLLSVALVPLPSRPTGLAVTPGNTTLSAQWTAATPAAGYPITDYELQLASNASGPWSLVAETATLQATIGGLTDGLVYFVSVRAVSGSGTSLASAVASGTPVGPPYPPTGVTVTATSASSFTVSWGPPAATGGSPISSYTVEYATNATGPWIPHGAGSARAATVGGLDPSTTYRVRVVAWNAVGVSHVSATVSATTRALPSSVTGGAGLSSGAAAAVLGGLSAALVGAVVGAVVLVDRRASRAAHAGPRGPPPAAVVDPPRPPATEDA